MNPIRSAVRRVLAALGLATQRRVDHLQQAVARAKAGADKSKRQLATVRAELKAVRGAVRRAGNATTSAARERDEARSRAEQLTAERDEWKRTATEWKGRAEGYRSTLRDTRGHLERVEQSTRLAHEHLMSNEVKLDLVDAAIQALDTRTRAVMPDGPVPATASPRDTTPQSESE